ncbi:MAG: hypothetical protein ACHQE5_06620 [Actinomycetes bacterium]
MAPYRTFAEPVEVTVAVTSPRYPVAGTFPGFALGWRGERVYVQWRTGVAENRFGWHEAAQVVRAVAPDPGPPGGQSSSGGSS